MLSDSESTPIFVPGILRAARRAQRRLALVEWSKVSAAALVWILLWAIVAETLRKLLLDPAALGVTLNAAQRFWFIRLTLLGWVVAVLSYCAVCFRTLRRSRHPLAGAERLDQFHGLSGRVANALAFAHQQDAWARAIVADAARFAPQISPERAVPIPRPPWLFPALGLALVLFGLESWQPKSALPARSVTSAPDHAAGEILSEEDLLFTRKAIAEISEGSSDPDTLVAMAQMRGLLERLEQRTLDRAGAFRELEALEQKLNLRSKETDAALDEGLSALSQQFKTAALAQPLSEALAKKDLQGAAQALTELSRKLEQAARGERRVAPAELERLRAALSRAGKSSGERQQRLDAERAQLHTEHERLLKKKQTGSNLSSGEQKQLERNEQELKRLERQKQRQDARDSELSELDRELAAAAQKLQQELSAAGKHLENAARSLSQQRQRKLNDADKRALKQQMEQLREQLQRRREESPQRQAQLSRFRRRAAGGRQEPQEGESSSAKSRPGAPRLGAGGQNGEILELPVPGGAARAAEKGQSDSAQDPGSGSGEWGKDSQVGIRGDATRQKGQFVDLGIAGAETGQGASATETVYGAAERGFRGTRYRDVYTDYRNVAEEALTQDEIPPGYQFYVRRYFQLIQPRQ